MVYLLVFLRFLMIVSATIAPARATTSPIEPQRRGLFDQKIRNALDATDTFVMVSS